MSHVTRAERIQAALFVLIGLSVLGIVLLLLLGFPFREEARLYFLSFEESVTGLVEQAPVRYKGVAGGHIRTIRIHPENPELIQVALAIRAGIPVTESTLARIGSGSILGPYHVELYDSRADSPPLPEGSEIKTGPSTFSRLLAKGETVGDQLAALLEQLQHLTDERNTELLWDLIRAGRQAVDAAKSEIEASSREFQRAAAAFAASNQQVLAILDDQTPRIDRLITDLLASSSRIRSVLESGQVENLIATAERAIAAIEQDVLRDGESLRQWLERNAITPEFERAANSLAKFLDDLQELSSRLGAEALALMRQDLAPALVDLRRSAETLSSLLELLSRQPNALLFGSPRPERPLPGGAGR